MIEIEKNIVFCVQIERKAVNMAQRAFAGYEPDSVALPEETEYQIRHNAAPLNHRIALHYHDHYEAFYSLSGNTLYAVEGERYRLDAGTLLFIAPYELHQPCSRQGACERIALRFDADLPRRLSGAGCDLSVCFSPAAPGHVRLLSLDAAQQGEMQRLLRGLLREQVEQDFGAQLAARVLLTQVFLLVGRAVRRGVHTTAVADPATRLVQQVVEYMERNYASGITLTDLEKRFYISRYQLSREFTRLMGCPPHRYLLQKRLLHAQRLLREGVQPQHAALKCGFSDYTNFYRHFRTAYGVSPREYRARNL